MCRNGQIGSSIEYLQSVGRGGFSVLWSHDPGVVATLLELHDNIDESSDTALHSLAQCSIVPRQNPSLREGVCCVCVRVCVCVCVPEWATECVKV